MAQGGSFIRQHGVTLLVALAGLCASAGAFWALEHRAREDASRRLVEVSQGLADRLRDTAFDLVHDAEALALLVTVQPNLDGERYREAVRFHRERRSPLGAILWIERVPGAERAAFEARMRERGAPDYRLTERDAEGRVVPAAPRAEYFPSVFMEPRPADASAQGFDLGSNVERWRAMRLARDTGRPAMTGRLRLNTAPNRPEGFQIFVPLYGGATRPASEIERREQLRGFVSVLLPVGELVDYTARDRLPEGWSLELRVPDAPADRHVLHAFGDAAGHERAQPVSLLGFRFDVAVRAPEAGTSRAALGALLAGLLATLVAASEVAHRRRAREQRAETEQRHRAALSKVEKQLHAAMDAAPEPMGLKDASRRFVFANRAFCALHGLSLEGIVGRTAADLFPGPLAELAERHDLECLREGKPRRYEFRQRDAEGHEVWIDLVKSPILDDRGAVVGLVSLGHDITERRAAEASRDREAQARVREALERYRLATEAAGIWVFSIDLATDALRVDEGALRHLGYAPGEFPATSNAWRDAMVLPSHHAGMREALVRHLRGESDHFQFSVPIRARDGREIWLRSLGRAERDAAGHAVRILGTVHDVTEGTRTRMALAEAERRWQFALDGAGHGVWDWDAATDKVYFSRRWKEMLGYAEDEVGDSLDEWKTRVHPDDLAHCYAELERHFAGETPLYASEHRLLCKDGAWKWIQDRGRVVERAADGKPLRVIGTHTDIDARKSAEQALADAAERQRAVLDNLLAAVIVIDERGTIEKFSRQAERIFGWTEAEVLGRNVSMLMGADLAAKHDGYLERYREGGPAFIVGSTREVVARHKDGHDVPIELGVTEHRYRGERRFTGMVRDLSDRRRAEQALADSEARFRQLFEHSPEPIVVHQSGFIESLNPAAMRMFGARHAEELSGRNIVEFIDAPLRGRAEARIASLMAAPGALPPTEYLQHGLDGRDLVVEATSASMRQGGRMRIVSLYRDVTARKRAEDAVAASERRLRQVIDLVPHLIYAKDREGRYLLSNKAHAAFYGRTPEEMLGLRVQDIGLGAEELANTVGGDERVWETGELQRQHDTTRIRPDGRSAEFDIVKMPFSYAGGAMDAVLGISIDITPLMVAQRQLKASLALLEATLESVDNGIVAFDGAGRVVRWNGAAPALIGVSESVLQDGDREAIRATTRDRIENAEEIFAIGAQADADQSFSGTSVARFRDGRYIERATRPIVVDESIAGRLWSFRDITAREREKQAAVLRASELQRLVAERTESLEEAVRDLNLFTSTVSHDLRAPLRAVDGFVRLALDAGESLPAEAKRNLDRVVAAVRTMSAMVEGLLALAKQARAPIHRSAVDLSATAREVADELPRESGRGVEFRIADTPAVQADAVLMRVVLQNLLGNALKYSRDRDPAVIEFGAEGAGAEVEWFVRDNGAGFDPRYAAKLFQPFARLHSPREFEGTGIGLAAVHRILERHGGGIRAESEPGKGATFRFRIGPG